jgi:hypothetical protein
MKEKVTISGSTCEYCGSIPELCDCCEGCIFPLSGHCENCDSCECHGCEK